MNPNDLLTEFDKRFIKTSMKDCTVGGEMTFPGGSKIPAPPPGKVWYINDGMIEVRNKDELAK